MWAYLNAFATLAGMALFFGIVWWAYSSGRKQANQEASLLPFALPDESLADTQNREGK